MFSGGYFYSFSVWAGLSPVSTKLIQIFFFISFLDYTLTGSSYKEGLLFLCWARLQPLCQHPCRFCFFPVSRTVWQWPQQVIHVTTITVVSGFWLHGGTLKAHHREPCWSWAFWKPTYEALWVLVYQEALTRNEFWIFWIYLIRWCFSFNVLM